MAAKTFNLMGIRTGDVGVLHNGERRRFLRYDEATDAKCPYIFEDGTGGECGRDVFGKLMPNGDPDLVHRDVELIERIPREGEWQPIETAPKDGTRMLMFWPYWRSDPVIGQWDGEWYSECQLADGPGPTHWMPLPAVPA